MDESIYDLLVPLTEDILNSPVENLSAYPSDVSVNNTECEVKKSASNLDRLQSESDEEHPAFFVPAIARVIKMRFRKAGRHQPLPFPDSDE